jgi:photosystem II stability/assembly factor-like uncharacterized protein
MTNRPVSDEFETMLRHAFADVSDAVHSPAGLADRLVADIRADRRPAARIDGARRTKRWGLPLLAAASVVAIAGAVAIVANVRSNDRPTPPAHSTSVPAPRPPAVPHFHAADIYFSDLHHGWALGDGQCGSSRKTDCPALLATADAGASWRAVTMPAGLVSTFDSASCGTNGDYAGPCVDNVLFADASDGYLWSLHEIYSTVDGGRHWRRYVDPAHDWDGAAQVAVAGNTAVRLAPVQQCSSGCPGSVETAPVGTSDWQVTTVAREQIGLYGSGLAGVGTDVYLLAAGTAANPSPGIFRSSDGGQHWTRIAHDVCGVASSPEQDAFWGAGSVLADDGALVAGCLDGGAAGSIRVAAPGTGAFSESRTLPGVDRTQVLAAQSQERIVVADESHADDGRASKMTFYETTDGGRSWQPTITLPVDRVRFSSGTDGYAITPSGTDYYVTSDGGITWHGKAFPA